MEVTWSNMEKKEKIMWIKKAAEDQKRYEVGVTLRKTSRSWRGSQYRASGRELTGPPLLCRESFTRCAPPLLLPLPQGKR